MSSPQWIESFCQHYALNGNATAAYIAVSYTHLTLPTIYSV